MDLFGNILDFLDGGLVGLTAWQVVVYTLVVTHILRTSPAARHITARHLP